MTIKEIPPSETWPLRQKVMWPEKPIEFVQLNEDEDGLHYGLFNGENLTAIVSCFETDGVMQFRKLATLTDQQNKGFGTALLNFIISEAKRKGIKRLWCNARSDKKGFYEKFGFTTCPKTFSKAGIAFVVMELSLD